MQHSPSIKMLIPSHQSIHIYLINLNDSSLCHAQIEIYQRPLLLKVLPQARGTDQRASSRSLCLPVAFHKWSDTELSKLSGSRLALRNLHGPERYAEAYLLMLLEEHVRGTSNVVRGSCCYKWALVNCIEKVCVGAADHQCLMHSGLTRRGSWSPLPACSVIYWCYKLCEFPMAAATNCHNVSGLKSLRFMTFWF